MLLEAKFLRFKQLKSRVNLTFATKSVDSVELMQATGTEGNLLFVSDEIKAEVEAAMRDKKIGMQESGWTKSQDMRGLIIQLWMEDNKGMDRDTYYRKYMDTVNNHIRSKLSE